MTRIVDKGTGEIMELEPEMLDANGEAAMAEAATQADEQEAAWMAVSEVQKGTAALIRIAPGKDVSIQRYFDEVATMQSHAKALTVADAESDKKATEDLSIIRKLKKEIEVAQKEWLAPLREYEKTIKQAFAVLLDPLAVVDKAYSDKILAYRQEQVRIAAETERIRQMEREAAEAKLRLAKEQGEAPESAMILDEPEELPEVTKKLQTELGTSSTTKNWKWRYKTGLSRTQIIDGLPKEYLLPDETKIGQMVRGKNKNQVTEIDFGGVIEIYEDMGLRVTTK